MAKESSEREFLKKKCVDHNRKRIKNLSNANAVKEKGFDELCCILQKLVGSAMKEQTRYITKVLLMVGLMVTKVARCRDYSQEDGLTDLSDSSYGVQHPERAFVSNIKQHSSSKRQSPYSYDNNLPWNCGSNVTWRDLGEMFFPRHIPEVVCQETACWFGHYRCQPVYKTIKVLKMNQGHCRDTALPVSLRTDWLMADVDISVFCQCCR